MNTVYSTPPIVNLWRHDNVMRPTVSAPPRLTKRKAADYASVATPAILPAIRHANSLPHVAAQTGASFHAVRTASV